MGDGRRRPWSRYRELIKSYPGQKESAGSVSLAKEDTASAYSTNTHQGVSTKVKNTNTLPAPSDTAQLAALAGSLIARVYFDEAEAPFRAPFLWKVEYVPSYSHADRWFESEAEAWEFATQQAELERKFTTQRPAWATDTDATSLSGDGEPVCVHMATVAEGKSWSVDFNRIDTITPAGPTIGAVEVVLSTSEDHMRPNELRAFAAALTAAADQLEVLGQ